MKITIPEPTQFTVADLKPGQVGVDRDGKLICGACSSVTFAFRFPEGTLPDHYTKIFRILPHGAKITVEVD